MKRLYLIFAVVLAVVLAQGCASSRGGDVYTRDEARRTMDVQFGVVEDVRRVLIEGTEGSVGTLAGAAVGGIAGSSVGGGRGSAIASVLGAVVGGMVGAGVEEEVTKRPGQEITVRLESGAIRAYVQETVEGDDFRPGDRVRIVTRGGVARVTH
jgi:outer membrane lipoprotein SlyB